MKMILEEKRFDILSKENKAFIITFDEEISKLGYGSGGNIGSGACWGKYMIVYSKIGIKNKQVAARIYIKENIVILRHFLNKIDAHRAYIENTERYIKEVFTGKHADCQHCHNEKNGACKFRKTYTIENQLYEKCNGITFEFQEPDLVRLPDYINLLEEFYSKRKS